MKRTLLTMLALGMGCTLMAQTITVKDTLMTTYPYGDPDPVARTGKIYPYWRFQEFSLKPQQQTWKMVVLENSYLRVKIFPEIGGKVWSIYDKQAGRELVYDNDAVKFREISLRGPWTSGGIEFNYGVIGHAPSCASPVDWRTEYKPDGSVSCYIGVLEMTSRSRWTIEVNLPKDAVYCRTRSIWYNLSGEWQPYYSWANSAVETSYDLVLVYPADNAIGHMGEIETYPVNEQGSDISLLSNQAYGNDKSYHMIGSHKSFFGAYYPSDDWASMHWSLRDEKLGRKYFTWAQSDQGNIWVDLLTDNRPQYVEMQSGRLYNQNEVGCCNDTPYRQILFSPYGTDEWSDFWMPVGGIGIADNVTLDAAVSVEKGKVSIYPFKASNDGVNIYGADGKAMSANCMLEPGKPVTLNLAFEPQEIRIGRRIVWQADDEKVDRPQTRVDGFDSESSEGLTMLAHDLVGLRMYADAEAKLDAALAMNALNMDALCLKTALLYRRMAYQEAYDCSSKALSVDQYNAEAGYFGGKAAVALGKDFDAMDRLEVAAIVDGPLRSACYTELARIRFCRGDVELAEDYARKALYSNGRNITALMMLCCMDAASEDEVARIDPLSHFPDIAKYLKGELDSAALAATFQEELPWEDYMELALFYHSMGLDKEASRILAAVPQQNVLTALWQAYLDADADAIKPALAQPMDFAFPFRTESSKMLEWVNGNGAGWQGCYLLALLKDSFGYKDEAKALLAGDDADYAPFYAYRYSLTNETADLRKAFSFDPGIRYRRLLAVDLNKKGKYAEVVGLLKGIYAANPDNFQVGDALMDAYIGLGDYKNAEKIIDKITYLPFEGMCGSHNKYRHIKLHLAAAACDAKQYKKALSLVDESLLWPTRLGAGKPYDELVDTAQEQWVREQIEARRDGRISGKLLPLMRDQRTTDKKLF